MGWAKSPNADIAIHQGELIFVSTCIRTLAGIQFNGVLLNYYQDGNDSVAWHSDRESVLGKNPIIASVSFGQVRSLISATKPITARNMP